MGLFNKIFGNDNKKLIVLGLDGVPYTFINRLVSEKRMPTLASLLKRGHFIRMNSVIPTISSVAWSSFMTGENASGHNIFGFIDRKPDPFKLFIPTARQRKGETIWAALEKQNKKSVVLNVPVTYPPDKINGAMVSGFLATDLAKAVYPAGLESELEELDYVIDADSWLARDSKQEFLDQLNHVLERRFETMFKFMENKEWDYLQCHIMETDRINHFFWKDMENKNQQFEESFYDFYSKIDDYINKLLEKIDNNTELIILSDHGFCGIKKEVQLNHWLEQEGYLKFENKNPENIEDMAADTKAYSLLPGRIFINLKDREEMGLVEKEEYENLRHEIKKGLINLKDEQTGDIIIKDVYYREDLYTGPYLEQAADLIAVPNEGYDLKGKVGAEQLLNDGFIQGMHTYDDAFIYLNNNDKNLNLDDIDKIQDVKRLILELLRTG